MVPPASQNSPAAVVTAERDNIAKIRDVAGSVDSIMQQVAEQEMQQVGHRHTYEEPLTEGDAQVLFGDEINGSGVMPKGTGSKYVKPVTRVNAQVQYGDRFNHGSFFTPRK